MWVLLLLLAQLVEAVEREGRNDGRRGEGEKGRRGEGRMKGVKDGRGKGGRISWSLGSSNTLRCHVTVANQRV